MEKTQVLPFTLFDLVFVKCLTGTVGLLTDCLTDSPTGLHITSMSDDVVFVASSISSPGKRMFHVRSTWKLDSLLLVFGLSSRPTRGMTTGIRLLPCWWRRVGDDFVAFG